MPANRIVFLVTAGIFRVVIKERVVSTKEVWQEMFNLLQRCTVDIPVPLHYFISVLYSLFLQTFNTFKTREAYMKAETLMHCMIQTQG